MQAPKYIPQINPVVFWDVSKDDFDYTKNSDFIICRVFNYGTFQEMADVIVCYGREYVTKLLISTTNLDPIGLESASAFLGIPETQFKCYELKQFPRSY